MTDAPVYWEWHARSAFSFLRGAAAPEALVRQVAESGLPGVAVTDRMGFYGSARAHGTATEAGVTARVGVELHLEDDSVLPVIVTDRPAYARLSRLLSQVHLRAEKGEGRVRWADLEDVSTEGWQALTGDAEGPVRRAWGTDGAKAAEAVAQRLARLFPDRLWVELQRHHRRGERREETALVDLAAHLRLPLLATNGVLYADPGGRRVQDVFTCLRHHTTLAAAGRLLADNAERHVKSAAEMAALFADRPEAIANTARLAERVGFTLCDLGYQFPRYPVPAGESMDSFLAKLTWFGAEQRYGGLTPPVRSQLRHELALIAKLGFSGYFLIVWDLVTYCREAGIMVQGRGSAANSAVCYSLGITAVDPVGGKLLFERFLSEGRKGWPDIDLDLPSGDRRERAIQEIYRRYGRFGAAMTANVITYRGRSAMRELGKVLEIEPLVVDKFSSLYGPGDYPHTLELQEQLAKSGLAGEHPRAGALVDLYGRLRRLPRHLGQHSGGMIIAEGELAAVVPLENARMPGRSVAQWDKDDCEDLGIIKVDLLGLGMMAVLQDALELTRARGRPVDLAKIPKDDPATFAMLTAADTIGVFQVESRAQMATLPRLQPKTFYDVVVEVAIIRPGPIHGKAVHPYLERRAGRAPVVYFHPLAEPILERTLGVVLFQEQMLQLAMVLAGFSGDQAEDLRRALGFHRSPERLERVQAKLRAALEERGHGPAVVEELLLACRSFALYGFPESHAISFALLAYGSAYLKAHRSVEFYAGLLNNQPMGFYSPATLLQDARRHGLRARPACVVASAVETTVEDDTTLRLGLQQVRGLRKEAAMRLVAAREARPWASLPDLLARVGLTPPERRALAAAGAFNALVPDRRTALWQVEVTDDGPLFARVAEDAAPAYAAEQQRSPLAPMTVVERVRADFDTTGVTTGRHPMAHLRARLAARGICSAAGLADVPSGARATIAGSVICRQRPGTAKGVVFISLEDETGVANAIVKPELFERHREVITLSPALLISGRLQHHQGTTHLLADHLRLLDDPDLPAGSSHDFH